MYKMKYISCDFVCRFIATTVWVISVPSFFAWPETGGFVSMLSRPSFIDFVIDLYEYLSADQQWSKWRVSY